MGPATAQTSTLPYSYK